MVSADYKEADTGSALFDSGATGSIVNSTGMMSSWAVAHDEATIHGIVTKSFTVNARGFLKQPLDKIPCILCKNFHL